MKIARNEVAGPGVSRPSLWNRTPADRGAELDMPLDLGERMPVATLVAWVHQAVGQLDWRHPLVVEYLRVYPEYQPRTLLSLLVLAYATQTFNSQEIVARCHSDRTFAMLCDGEIPFARELIRFRRKNRLLITKVLADVMVSFLQSGAGWNSLAVPSRELVEEVAGGRIDIARHMDVCD